MKTVIMDDVRIQRTMKRIAFQILEHCYQEKEITIMGMEPRGVWVAEELIAHIGSISKTKITSLQINIDKLDAIAEMSKEVSGKTVILVDDVVKSGRTLMHAASSIMALEPQTLYTACLVDRKHRRYPIQSDFTGMTLATTLQEHIQLVMKPKPTVFLE